MATITCKPNASEFSTHATTSVPQRGELVLARPGIFLNQMSVHEVLPCQVHMHYEVREALALTRPVVEVDGDTCLPMVFPHGVPPVMSRRHVVPLVSPAAPQALYFTPCLLVRSQEEHIFAPCIVLTAPQGPRGKG